MTDRQTITAALSATGSQSAAARALGITRMQLRRRCIALGIPMPRGSTAPPRKAIIAVDVVSAARETGSIIEAARAIGVSTTLAYDRLRDAGIKPDSLGLVGRKRGRKRVAVTVDDIRVAAQEHGGVTRGAVALGVSPTTAYKMLRDAEAAAQADQGNGTPR